MNKAYLLFPFGIAIGLTFGLSKQFLSLNDPPNKTHVSASPGEKPGEKPIFAPTATNIPPVSALKSDLVLIGDNVKSSDPSSEQIYDEQDTSSVLVSEGSPELKAVQKETPFPGVTEEVKETGLPEMGNSVPEISSGRSSDRKEPHPEKPKPAPVNVQQIPVKVTPKVTEYGKSVEQRPLKVIFLGNGPEYIYILGGFHGDEGPAVSDLVERTKATLASQPSLLQGHTVICIPVVNPDGWSRRTRQNARGVDLNRNFDTSNFTVSQKGRYYSGPRPLSEPESLALKNLLNRFPPKRILTIHAPMKMVNYDGPAERLATAMSRVNGLPPKGDIGYPTPGSFGSLYGKIKRIPVITLEIGPNEDPAAAWKRYGDSILTFVKGGN